MKKYILSGLLSLVATTQSFAMEGAGETLVETEAQTTIREANPAPITLMENIQLLLPEDPVIRAKVIKLAYLLYTSEFTMKFIDILESLTKENIDPKSLVVFDIDDTALYSVSTLQILSPEAHITNHLNLPPIETILNLYKEIKKLGYKTIFLTARSEHLLMAGDFANIPVTEANLRQVGYENFEGVYFYPNFLPSATPIELAHLIAEWKQETMLELEKEQGFKVCAFLDDDGMNINPADPRHFKIPGFKEVLLKLLQTLPSKNPSPVTATPQ